MSQELIAAANMLADTLAKENVALTALDLPRAASMLADKQRAVAGFLTACDAERTATVHATIAPLAQRLRLLSEENRTLLDSRASRRAPGCDIGLFGPGHPRS